MERAGWTLVTEFLVMDEAEGGYEEEHDNFIKLDELEIIHLRLLQYHKDFGFLPNIGEHISDGIERIKIVEKTIDLKEKTIILGLT